MNNQTNTLTYSLDYPAELWQQHNSPAREAILAVRQASRELDSMLGLARSYHWTNTWNAHENTVRLVIYLTFEPAELAWLLLQYPEARHKIAV